MSVAACPPPPPSPGGEGGLCFLLRAILVIAAILAGMSTYVLLCVPAASPYWLWVALTFAAIAGLAAAFWALFCPKPCGWALLFAWQIALGLGVTAFYFASCCHWLGFVGAGFVLTAVALAVAWALHCHATLCELSAEVSIVVVAVFLPIVGWLVDIPALAACMSKTAAAVVSAFSALVALEVASCVLKKGPPPTP